MISVKLTEINNNIGGMMKKVAVLLIVLLGISVLFANDAMLPNRTPREMENYKTFTFDIASRNAPNVEFMVDPQVVSSTFQDYMIGGYNSPPIRMQPELSEPIGYPAEGYYAAFMYKDSPSTNRRVYYSYINSTGSVSSPAPVGSNDVREGYMGIDVDPVSANPLIAWHANGDADVQLEIMFSYDLYNIVGSPGLWKEPYAVIDNPMEQFPNYQEFIWPVVNIGPSPEEGKRRVHVYGNYYPESGSAHYNCIYGHSDFYYDDVAFDFIFDEWSFQTIPLFDYWQDNDIKRAIKEIAVSEVDGSVAFVGHANDSLFAVVSSDYGDTFTANMYDAHYPVFNPQNEDGTYYFTDEERDPSEMFIGPNGDGGHFNAVFDYENNKIIFMSAMGANSEAGLANSTYLPAFFEPKIFKFDLDTQEYSFVDLQITGADPNDDQPMIPWDLDEDGVVDSYDSDGLVEFVDCWPTYYYAGEFQDGSFHESNFKLSTSEDSSIMVAVFQDGRKQRQAYLENPDYADWLEISEIAISVSSDYGQTWSDVAYMNANSTDENYHAGLEGMKPCYVYPADKLTVQEDYVTVPLMFLDDNSFGSYESPYTGGQPNGGNIVFSVLKVDVTATPPSSPGDTVPALATMQQNYPNPFNPATTIDYEVVRAGQVELEIFNAKGQKVKTLVDGHRAADNYSATWDGRDSAGNSCSSGIYFYKLKSSAQTQVKKMILMK